MPSRADAVRGSAWNRARRLAEATPDSRNRYVDFLRAVSIGAVVFGHWLIAAPSVRDGRLALDHMLSVSPWTQWLTWLMQVMPVFFMVGGYSNAVSWESARRSGRGYRVWVDARLRRLVGPLVPLLVVWTLIALIAHRLGVSPGMIKIGSQAALVPLWFLAVYVLVIVLCPITHRAWRAFGIGSFWTLALAAVVVDLLRFGAGLTALSWINYLFVWLAVHQLGYLWRDGRFEAPAWALAWGAAGLVLLVGLVTVGGYPRSMVGVPGQEVSNTLPPSLAMLALGMLQGGLLLALERPARRWLAKPVPWTATILINGMIMSVYLWHLTAMVMVIALLNELGGIGLGLEPGTGAWWATRPVWMAVLAGLLWLFLLVFARFERPRDREGRIVPPAWRTIAGATMVCGALAMIALDGIGADGVLGVRVWVLGTAFLGAALSGGLHFR